MTDKREKEVRAEVAIQKAKKTILSAELRELIIDTSRLKNRKSSTEILKELRYQTK